MVEPIELCMDSADWGDANRNPMVRAYGKKKGPLAKCQSCVHFFMNNEGILTCGFRYPVEHNPKWIACSRYKNNKKGVKTNDYRYLWWNE